MTPSMEPHHPNLSPRLSGGPRPTGQLTLDLASVGDALVAHGGRSLRDKYADSLGAQEAEREHEQEDLAAARWARARSAGVVADGCSYCESHWPGMMPSHTASPRCESGKRSHCSCDTCF